MKYTKLKMQEDDDMIFKDTKPLGFSVKTQTSHTFIVHINEEIQGADYYSQIFDLLLEAGEEDCIQFFIESPGGDVSGLNTLLEGIKITEAHVVGIIVGDASSAASILALNCHEVVVLDGAQMLVHTSRTGFGGKSPDLEAYTAHNKKFTAKLLTNTYSGFLTEDELSRVMDGKEMYMDADEIRERLEARAEYLIGGEIEPDEHPEAPPSAEVRPKKRRGKTKEE